MLEKNIIISTPAPHVGLLVASNEGRSVAARVAVVRTDMLDRGMLGGPAWVRAHDTNDLLVYGSCTGAQDSPWVGFHIQQFVAPSY